jgi:hypothetical protein
LYSYSKEKNSKDYSLKSNTPLTNSNKKISNFNTNQTFKEETIENSVKDGGSMRNFNKSLAHLIDRHKIKENFKHYIVYGGFKGGSLRVPWIVQRICWYLYRHRVHSKKKSDFL